MLSAVLSCILHSWLGDNLKFFFVLPHLQASMAVIAAWGCPGSGRKPEPSSLYINSPANFELPLLMGCFGWCVDYLLTISMVSKCNKYFLKHRGNFKITLKQILEIRTFVLVWFGLVMWLLNHTQS